MRSDLSEKRFVAYEGTQPAPCIRRASEFDDTTVEGLPTRLLPAHPFGAGLRPVRYGAGELGELFEAAGL